jgi:hypothetical protein
MQENKTTTIHLRSFAEKYLQFIKNNHANPSCNTFLQEKHHRMPKNLSLQQVRLPQISQ